MQKIISISLSPEEYAKQEYHRQVKAPETCPNCRKALCLEALGYYWRWITQLAAEVLRIKIRRFRCLTCGISVSCLPGFAQPYRLVNTATIQAAFQGEKCRPEVQRWMGLLVVYWRRYANHLPRLVQQVGNAFGPLRLGVTPEKFWKQLLKSCGDLASATRQLVHIHQTCLFGTYRCHQRKTSRVA